MKISACLLLLLFCTFPARAEWQLNDISILMPLPEPGHADQLWRATEALLPAYVYQQLPMLVVVRDRDWLYENLRVVGVRIDPCFRDSSAPCQKQIRFAWQPLEEVRGSYTTLDAAVHTFHTLSDAAWQKLVSGLTRIKKRNPLPDSLPLSVHPLLATGGMTGAYGRELAALLLSLCTPQNLTRATAMTVNTEGTVWVFTGFDILGRELKRMAIPRVNHVAQAFFSGLGNTQEFLATMNPVPAADFPFLRVLADSALARKELEEMEISEAVRRGLVFQNPRLSHPGNVDCASCHASRALPYWAERSFPSWNWQSMFGDELFRGPGNLANSTVGPSRTNVLRAFGYFGRDPVIAPRVVFESSMTVEALSQTSAKKRNR